MNRRRVAAPAVALVTGALVLTACGSREPTVGGAEGDSAAAAVEGDKGTVTVGLLNAQTGPFAADGEEVNRGFELYVESQGGTLGGYGIEIIKEDEANDAGIATTKARKLVEQDEADVVVGLTNSAVAYAVAPYLQEQEVPLVITIAGSDGLTREENSSVFRVSYTGSQDTMPMGEYACTELGHETATIISLDYAFGWEAAGGFARTFEHAGCEVVQELYPPLGTQDYGPYITQVDPDADMVYVVAPASDGLRLFQAAKGFGLETPILAHGATTDELHLSQMGGAAEGVMTSHHYAVPAENAANEEFVAAWTEEAGQLPGLAAENGWTAAMVLEAALSDLDGEVTPADLTEALRDVEIEAPRGPQSFDEYGQSVYNVYIREVSEQDGEWVNAVVDTVEDVSQFYTYDPAEYLDFESYEALRGTWAD
jgi:branched-chain amino acid transport system substrate-binding protein